MKPEEKARQDIYKLLEVAGWNVQDYKDLYLGASLGVSARFCEAVQRGKESEGKVEN